MDGRCRDGYAITGQERTAASFHVQCEKDVVLASIGRGPLPRPFAGHMHRIGMHETLSVPNAAWEVPRKRTLEGVKQRWLERESKASEQLPMDHVSDEP